MRPPRDPLSQAAGSWSSTEVNNVVRWLEMMCYESPDWVLSFSSLSVGSSLDMDQGSDTGRGAETEEKRDTSLGPLFSTFPLITLN